MVTIAAYAQSMKRIPPFDEPPDRTDEISHKNCEASQHCRIGNQPKSVTNTRPLDKHAKQKSPNKEHPSDRVPVLHPVTSPEAEQTYAKPIS